MAYGLVEISYLSDIASAIREMNGLTRTYKPSEMAAAIRALGGSQDSGEHTGPYSIYNTTAAYVSSSAYKADVYLNAATFTAAKSVYDSAFYNCDLLSVVSLPSATHIAANAFFSCDRLASVSLPMASDIGSSAFYDCGSLTRVSLPNCSYIGSYAFYNCSQLSSVSLPMVSYIEAQAFRSCESLTSVSLPNCSYISSGAFYSCTNLKSIYAPACTYLGEYAFRFTQISSITMPALTEAAPQAFHTAASLRTVNLPLCRTIGYSCFQGCEMLSYLSIPVCKSIGSLAFYDCATLSSLALPACSYIGSGAFTWCTNLSCLDFTGVSSVPTLANQYMFEGTPFVTSSNIGTYGSIYVPSSLYNSFIVAYGWSSLSSRIVSVSGTAQSSTTPTGAYSIYDTTTVDIPSKAYYNDTNLTKATYTVATRVNPSAFEGCTALSRVELPVCSNCISNRAFFGCTSLMTVVLTSADYVPDYGVAAFANTPIDNSAYTGAYGSIYVDPARHANFSHSPGWSTIISRITPRPVDGIAFEATSHNSSYSIYDTTATYISSFTFAGDKFLTSATFTKVRFIEYNAFYDCGDLSYLSLPECTYIGPTIRVVNDFSGFKFAGLTSLYLPKASYVEGFDNCYSLSRISLPAALDVTGFEYCMISRLSLPKAEFVCGFDGIDELTSLSLPAVRYIQGFHGCDGLTTVSLPNAYSLAYAFSSCRNLATIRLSVATELGTDLAGCYALRDIYMNRANTESFSVVTARNGGGYSFLTIHVPSDMVSDLNYRYSDYSSVARFVAI